MNRLGKLITSSVIGVTIVGGSLFAASPAMAASVIDWIIEPTQSSCNGAVEGSVRAASYSGYKNIKSVKCYRSHGQWEGWVSYTKP